MRIKSLSIIFAIVILSSYGCKQILKKNENLMSNKIINFEKIFKERTTKEINIDDDGELIIFNIYDVPQIIQFNFNFEGIEDIYAIKLKEKYKLNISRYLLYGSEYQKEIKDSSVTLNLHLELPIIYLLDNKALFEIEIICSEYLKEKIIIKKIYKKLMAIWMPAKNVNEEGITYFENQEEYIKYLRKNMISNIKSEYNNTNNTRINKKYNEHIKKIIK